MRRRLDLASALIGRPRLLILDEPTTGLDPRSRLSMWAIIRDLVKDGTTVLLTTQYLEEADELADSIVVVDHGKIIARGTPSELKRQVGGARIEVIAHRAEDIPGHRGRDGAAVRLRCRRGRGRPDASAWPPGTRTDRLFSTFRELDAAGIEVDDIGLRHPTLDDVFLSLTGHVAEAARRQASETHLVHAADLAGVER